MTFAGQIGLGSRPIVIAEVVGWGDGDGIYRFCTQLPSYATSQYLPLLMSYPQELSEVYSIHGGVGTFGEISLSILDADRIVSQMLSVKRPHFCRLTADIDDSTTSVAMSKGSITTDSILYIGAEAMKVTDGAVSPHTVERGALGTPATPHKSGELFYTVPHYLYGRRIDLYLAWSDDVADEIFIGSWFLDQVELDHGLNSFTLRGRSQLRYLDRLIMRNQLTGVIKSLTSKNSYFAPCTIEWEGNIVPDAARFVGSAGSGSYFGAEPLAVKTDKEIFAWEPYVSTSSPLIGPIGGLVRQRGVGSEIAELKAGTRVQLALVSDTDSLCPQFRYQEKGAESTSTDQANWTETSHPVPIILALLTSHADPDKAGVANYTANQGNFNCLPASWGLGIPSSKIDFDSFWDAWYATQDWALDAFYLDESRKGKEIINELLRILGAVIRIGSNDTLEIVLIRTPDYTATKSTWDDSVLLGTPMADGLWDPELDCELTKELVTAVEYVSHTPDGQERTNTFQSLDAPLVTGNLNAYYESEDRTYKVDPSYLRTDTAGSLPAWAHQRALQILARGVYPTLQVRFRTGLGVIGTHYPGDIVSITHNQLPNLTTQVRGVTDAFLFLTSKTLIVSDDFTGVEWTGIVYDEQRAKVGKIAPSAMIASVSTNTATCEANRYTDSEITTDVDEFAVGDRVRLRNRDGTVIATTPTYQTVQSIGTNTLTLDGNFGSHGSFADGTVIEYVAESDATEDQLTRVYLGNSDDLVAGSAVPDVFVFGEM